MNYYLTPNDTVRMSDARWSRQAFMEALDEYSDGQMRVRILWMIERLADCLVEEKRVKSPQIALDYATDFFAACVEKKITAGAGRKARDDE